MYIVTNRLEIPAERAEAFEARFTSNMDTNLADVAGLLRAALQRPVEDGQPYLAVMEFDSEGDYTAWRDSEAFSRSHGKLSQGGGGAPDAAHGRHAANHAPAEARTTTANAVERYELVHEVFPASTN